MATSKSKQMNISLLGLLAAFLLSSIVLPAFGEAQNFDAHSKEQISNTTDPHSTPQSPLPLPEEEKEEESRDHKDYPLAAIEFVIEFELLNLVQAGPTTWEFNHTNSASLSDFPIYLGQHSLLI